MTIKNLHPSLLPSLPPSTQLVNGVSRSYVLKDNHCLHRAKGVVHLKCDFVYNPLRAAVRTINPREDKVLEEDEKFDRKVCSN